MVRELVESRELLWSLVRRDLTLRYKHTVLGFGWAVFIPVVHTVVFTVVFTRVVSLDTGVPYPVYAYAGLLPWNLFASALRFSAVSLTANAALVTKVAFPREVLPLSAVLVAVVDFGVAATVLGGLMVWYGSTTTWTALWLPVVLLVEVMFTAGLALLAAMAHLYWRDVKYVFEVVLLVAMFGTSVVYPVERFGGRLATVLALNPMTPIIESYRAVLLHGEVPGAAFAAAAVVAFATFAGGWLVFHRAEARFAEDI